MTPKQRLSEIELFFSSANLPEIIKLEDYTTITNVKSFVNSHLEMCRSNINKELSLPYLERLEKLKNKLNLLLRKTL